MAKYETKNLTIYNKLYKLPVLEGNYFNYIQEQIKERQSLIKKEKRVKKSIFGIIKVTKKLTFEEKFYELESLVKDYKQLVSFLAQHKKIYQRFFSELTVNLRKIVHTKLNQSAQQEKKRLALLKGESEHDLIAMLESQKEQVLSNIWIFGKAFLLMLKKIDLIDEAIETITTYQDIQKQYLISMVEKLGKYREVYKLQMEINKPTKKAQQIAVSTINLEQYLKDFISDFQDSINEICKQDNTIRDTVTEIQSLVKDIMTSKIGNLVSTKDNDLSKNMLDFIITNEEKKERLIVAVEESKKQGIEYSWKEIDIDDRSDLTTTINTLFSHIDSKLGEYIKQETSVIASETKQSQNYSNQQISLNQVNYSSSYTLESEKNLNYKKLEYLLKIGEFKEADKETTTLILKATDKNSWMDVYPDDLLNFPKTDLRTMDQLWLNYSYGKFGFSVQKQIWIECGGTPGKYDSIVAQKFSDRIGWKKDGIGWLNYSQLNFNINAPIRYLPWSWCRLCGNVRLGISLLCSRL